MNTNNCNDDNYNDNTVEKANFHFYKGLNMSKKRFYDFLIDKEQKNETAILHLNKASTIYKITGDIYNSIYCHVNIAKIYELNNNLLDSYKEYKYTAEQYLKEKDSIRSITNYNEALRIAVLKNDFDKAGKMAKEIGLIYLNDDRIDESIKYLLQSISYFELANNDTSNYIRDVHIKLGDIFVKKHDFIEAKKHYNIVVELLMKANLKMSVNIYILNKFLAAIADSYLEINNVKKEMYTIYSFNKSFEYNLLNDIINIIEEQSNINIITSNHIYNTNAITKYICDYILKHIYNGLIEL